MSGSNLIPIWQKALLFNEKATIQKLLDDAAINVANDEGLTPLHIVAKTGSRNNLLKELIAKGALVDAKKTDGKTPLFIAATMGATKNVETLLAAGADPNVILPGQDNENPMYNACEHGDIPIVKALLAAGANVNIIGPMGYTPLHVAVEEERTKLVKVLLDAGANISIKNRGGQTALEMASGAMKNILTKYPQMKRGSNFVSSLFQMKELPTEILAKVAEYNTPGSGKYVRGVDAVYTPRNKLAMENKNMPALEPISVMENVDGGRRKRKTRKSKSRKQRTLKRKHK
jgi:hypothetical protein